MRSWGWLAALILIALGTGVTAAWRLNRESRPVRTDSEVAYRHYRSGLHALERQEPEAAAREFEAAIEADAEFVMAWLQLYKARLELEDREGAGAAIARAYELRTQAPTRERLQVEMGEALFRYDFDAYKRLGDELVANDPDDPASLRYAAMQARRDRNYAEALRCLERVLEKEPERVESHQEIAEICLWKGDYEQAIDSLERYVFYAPEHAKSYERLGGALLLTGRYDEAIANFEIALEKDPAFVDAVGGLATSYLMTGQLHRAREVLEHFRPAFEQRKRLLSLEQQQWFIDYVAHDWDAILHKTQRHLPLAKEINEERLDFPVFVMLLRSIALAEKGQAEASTAAAREMNEHLDRIFTRYPKSMDSNETVRLLTAMVNLRAALVLGNLKPAVDEMRQAIDGSGLSPHVLADYRTELARAYLQQGLHDEVVAQAEAVLIPIPTYPDMLLLAAKAQVKKGDDTGASTYLRRYLDVMAKADAEHPDVLEAIALWRRIAPTM